MVGVTTGKVKKILLHSYATRIGMPSVQKRWHQRANYLLILYCKVLYNYNAIDQNLYLFYDYYCLLSKPFRIVERYPVYSYSTCINSYQILWVTWLIGYNFFNYHNRKSVESLNNAVNEICLIYWPALTDWPKLTNLLIDWPTIRLLNYWLEPLWHSVHFLPKCSPFTQNA